MMLQGCDEVSVNCLLAVNLQWYLSHVVLVWLGLGSINLHFQLQKTTLQSWCSALLNGQIYSF